ncbi:RNA polymerase sigma factor [Emticicia sp. C21]|uniref:RNA polymerase sigma factor n=1 Tax=Emticicia sp. C21 TaxID=2302915 RepID=UPI000E34342B|nr:sigma-70 family RNA polymerase sigma factor [Emticicia sp. C21]RFS17434.1 sigma-70 family RNA polymerase sigma factor [Emticicia sp. C21]
MSSDSKDIALWQAFKNGDRDAFAKIYNLFIEDLLSYGYRVTNDRQLIRDSIQDLFLHLWHTRENLTDTDSIRFYLYVSLRNRILRNIEKHNHTSIDTQDLFENIIGVLSVEDELITTEQYSEQIIQLKRAIQQLPKRQQEIIQLRYYHDFSFEEIAGMMQINNQSVRNLLHRAITELRQYFTPFLLLFIAFLISSKKN